MYNHSYGPEFLAEPDRLEKLPCDGDLLDLEIRTRRSCGDQDYDFLALYRIIHPEMKDYPAAICTHAVKDGAVVWCDLQQHKGYRGAGFPELFEDQSQKLSWEMGFAANNAVQDEKGSDST